MQVGILHSTYTNLGCIMATFGLVVLACGPDEPNPAVPMTEQAIEAGLMAFVLPPVNAACGSVQPGFVEAETEEECPTLNGECYDVWNDDFCTPIWQYRFVREGDRLYHEWYTYITDMGEVDPSKALPPHLDALYPAARDSALYCKWRWSLEVESVPPYPEEDIQRFEATLEEVSYYCSDAYTPSGWVIGEQRGFYLFRSTNPEVVLFLDEPLSSQPVEAPTFQGYVGMQEMGGWHPLEDAELGGWMFFYQRCDPEPAADGNGIGLCGDPDICRYFTAGAGRDKCDFSDVNALPANPDLIDPNWRALNPQIYRAVFGE
jgi:hypothetical protein